MRSGSFASAGKIALTSVVCIFSDQKVYVPTKASPKADARAEVKRKILVTKDFMFFGPFVYAYSNPVIEAKISLKATKTYLNGLKQCQRYFAFGRI